MSEIKQLEGTIFGKNLNRITFVFNSLDHNGEYTDVEVGHLLAIKDTPSRSTFIVRVTDIEYGQQDEWTKHVARDMNDIRKESFEDEHETPSSLHDMHDPKQLYLVAVCEPLGLMGDNGSFVSPKRLPAYFSPVEKVSEKHFKDTLKNKLGDLQIGNVRSGSDILDIKAGVFSELLSYHIGVFARTGRGKSNAIKTLIGVIMTTKGKASTLIFEPHGEYLDDLKRHPLAKEQLVCFTQKKDKGSPDRIIKISYKDITVDALMNIKDELHWTDAQERFLREASYAYKDWLKKIMTMPINGNELESFLSEGSYSLTFMDDEELGGKQTLAALFPDYKEDTLKAIRSKLRQVVEAAYVTEDDSRSNVQEILELIDKGKTVLIDMASLSGMHELFLSTVLSTKTLSRRRKQYEVDRKKLETETPPVAIVMEEAQRVLGESSRSNIFTSIVNEGRKYKVGLVAITQQSKSMNERILSQFNTLIALGIGDEKDFKILSSVSEQPLDRLQNEIRSLMPGEAIITSPKSPFAVPVKIYLYDDYLKMLKKSMKEDTSKPKTDQFKSFFQ